MPVSFVAAGSSSATDGGSDPTPGLPAGLVVGDVMICVVYTRNTSIGVVSISAGWDEIKQDLSSSGLIAVYARRYQAGDAAPTITLAGHTGGASGDTAIAQIAAFRDVRYFGALDIGVSTIFDNASAQNIGPADYLDVDPGDAWVVIGGKMDDWTSVATLASTLTWTEIGEPDSASGADAGMVWDLGVNGGGTTVDPSAKTFTVSGGASAPGKALILYLEFEVFVPSDGAVNMLLVGVG